MKLIYTVLNDSDLALVRGLTQAWKTTFMANYCNYSVYPTVIIMNDESMASYNRILDIGNISGQALTLFLILQISNRYCCVIVTRKSPN